jgi:hypothetical protein
MTYVSSHSPRAVLQPGLHMSWALRVYHMTTFPIAWNRLEVSCCSWAPWQLWICYDFNYKWNIHKWMSIVVLSQMFDRDCGLILVIAVTFAIFSPVTACQYWGTAMFSSVSPGKSCDSTLGNGMIPYRPLATHILSAHMLNSFSDLYSWNILVK